MPSIIRVLDDTTINQIAAGEVVENPASVVKELVENSLDAKATSICVEIKGGGRQLIRISDNGSGMNRDDALLCFERHATSKVSKIDDLERLYTMGFRGEALPSIASIARVRLTTRPRDQPDGTLVEIEAGCIKTVAPVACDVGTKCEVRDLFFNVPARKKFLKSPAYDTQEIRKIITALALGNPEVHFQLIVDGENGLDLPIAENLQVRAGQLLHPEIVENMFPLEFFQEGIKVSGLIGWPTLHRPNRSNQSLFINKRPVVSWLVSQAVAEGYGSALPERRYPVFVLNLEISSAEVDVNVHPQKREVRFRHEMQLKDILRQAIATAWGAPPKTSDRVEFATTYELSHSPPPVFKERESFTFHSPERPAIFNESTSFAFQPLANPLDIPRVIGTCLHYVFIDRSPQSKGEELGCCLYDSSRAKARLLYEQFLHKLQSGKVEAQSLLLPITLEVPKEDYARVEQHVNDFAQIGFVIRPFGSTTWMVETIPAEIDANEVPRIFYAVLESLKEETGTKWKQEQYHQIALAASQVKMSSIHKEEAEILLKQLLQCQQPYFSPNGQPIFAWISEGKLKEFFK